MPPAKKQKTPNLDNLLPETERCYLVVLGFPVEFDPQGNGLEQAHDFAANLVNRTSARHATILVVDKNWQDYTMVAEKIGTVFTIPDEMRLPGPDTSEDYWENL